MAYISFFLFIFYKKERFDFISIISFSLDKIKMKWYNQSTICYGPNSIAKIKNFLKRRT
jgi:hypothetical protein